MVEGLELIEDTQFNVACMEFQGSFDCFDEMLVSLDKDIARLSPITLLRDFLGDRTT